MVTKGTQAFFFVGGEGTWIGGQSSRDPLSAYDHLRLFFFFLGKIAHCVIIPVYFKY